MKEAKKKSTKIKNGRMSKQRKTYNTSQYTQETLGEAIAQVQSGALSINKASLQFVIPKGTLINKLRLGTSTISKRGPTPILTIDEEARIRQWIVDKAAIGYAMHPTIVKLAIKSVLDKAPRPNPFVNNLPGNKWFQLFLKRHPDIGLKNTEVLSKSRASVTEKDLREWFSNFKSYLIKENAEGILNNPSRIYNLDETGVQLCPKTGKLLGLKKEKNMYYISPGQEKENITVLGCYGADGSEVSPMIVYPYKRFPPKEVANSVPDNFIIGHSPSGWMNIDTYNSYIKNGFHKTLVERNVQFPVILLFDGHKSHISLELHEFCVENQILLYLFYPNATHLMQPCDVGIFKPLKTAWKKQVLLHSQTSNKPISKVNFAPLFSLAHKQACTPEVVKKAFESCGLYPFNPDRIDYTKCMSNRHESVKKNVYNINDSTDSLDNCLLLNIETDIPADTLHKFEEAYKNKTFPTEEVIVFKLWKKFKENGSQLLSDNSERVLETISTTTTANQLEINSDLNVDECVSEPLAENQQMECINSLESIEEPMDLSIADLPIIFADNVILNTELATTDIQSHCSSKTQNLESSFTSSTLESNTTITSVSFHQTENIWKNELHFPQIVKSKQKRMKKINNFAISSKEWKEEQEIKKKKEEELKRQKELRQFERELKKKIKLEEDEIKKKEREIKKKAQLKNKMEKENKQKAKKAQINARVAQKAKLCDITLQPSSLDGQVFNSINNK